MVREVVVGPVDNVRNALYTSYPHRIGRMFLAVNNRTFFKGFWETTPECGFCGK